MSAQTNNDIPFLAAVKKTITTKLYDIISNPVVYAIASIIEVIILVLILYKWNPFNVSGKLPALCSIFIMFVVFFQLMTFMFVYDKQNPASTSGIAPETTFLDVATKIIITLTTICGMVLFIYSIIWLSSKFPSAATGLLYFLNILIAISTIAILYTVVNSYFNTGANESKINGKTKKTFEFISALVMYAPCALIDIVEWAKTQYNITTNSVLILLAFEFFLISLRILIPKLLRTIVKSDSLQLLRDPIYLNNITDLGKYTGLHKDKPEHEREYIYSLSAWFWINPQPPSTRIAYTKYTNIIEYGRQPAVEFNGLENTLRVNCRISDTSEITIAKVKNVDLQVWNNIVINYDGSTMDVFLNGELVGSKPNISPSGIKTTHISVGEEKGIEGGICNVTVTDKIRQKSQIAITYKTLRELHIPLV